MPKPNSQRPDLLPVIVLLGVVGVICIGFWLFPYVQKVIQREDCISVGRQDCG